MSDKAAIATLAVEGAITAEELVYTYALETSDYFLHVAGSGHGMAALTN